MNSCIRNALFFLLLVCGTLSNPITTPEPDDDGTTTTDSSVTSPEPVVKEEVDVGDNTATEPAEVEIQAEEGGEETVVTEEPTTTAGAESVKAKFAAIVLASMLPLLL
uniref:uncharacterized protein LOC120342827 n=1 Tax=Styela clava TaxID=7725 RepID=UPI00193A97E9|nr:uncharacterized protein LOC120342827 [Styela clava]